MVLFLKLVIHFGEAVSGTSVVILVCPSTCSICLRFSQFFLNPGSVFVLSVLHLKYMEVLFFFVDTCNVYYCFTMLDCYCTSAPRIYKRGGFY
jgi:hypothetical protein